MKRLSIILLLLATIFTVWGARERNYIFIFDCTQSMDGYGGAPKVWAPAKDFLRRNIERKSQDGTITIVPFQGKALAPITFKRSDFNWEKVEKQLDEYIVNITNTNIKDAWNSGNTFIDPNKNNYLFLLTDGRDQDPNALYNILNSWCGKYPNTKAYFVGLTDNSNDPKLKEIINQCQDMDWVSATDDVEDFGALDQLKIVITIDNIAKGKPALLGFSDEGHFPGRVICDDEYFDVKLIGDLSSTIELSVTPKSGYSIMDLRQELDERYDFGIKILSDKIHIINPDVEVEVINRPVPQLTLTALDSQETELDDSEYYPSFLGIFKASAEGSTSIDLKPEFNDIAKRQGATAEFEITGKDGFKDFRVLYNGSEIPDNRFTISPGDTESELTIIFDEKAEDGKHRFILKSLPSPIEIINDQEVSPTDPFITTLRADYDVNWNPWKTLFFWILMALLALLILWFAVLKRMIYPPIRGVNSIMITSPYYSNKKVRGAYKVIYSQKRIDQGLLSRIFQGKIINEVQSVWTSNFELSAGRRGLRVKPNSDYIINPYSSTLAKNSQYTIDIKDTKTKINITIN